MRAIIIRIIVALLFIAFGVYPLVNMALKSIRNDEISIVFLIEASFFSLFGIALIIWGVGFYQEQKAAYQQKGLLREEKYNKIRIEGKLKRRFIELIEQHKNTLLQRHGQLAVDGDDGHGQEMAGQWDDEKLRFLKDVIENDPAVIDLASQLNEKLEVVMNSEKRFIFNEIEQIINGW